MKNSGNIRYKFDKKSGGYVVVIASAINGGIDIPPLYNDGKNGEHPVVEIGNEAFALSDAEYVRIPESVVKISTDALYAYVALENIFVDENNPVYKSIDGNLYSKDGKKIIRYAKAKKNTSFDIPNGVVEIGDFAFFGSKNLASVTIPESITKIGEWAFALGGLKIANVPHKVKTIGDYAFDGCENLEQVYIPAAVTHIGEFSFYNCHCLRFILVDKQNPVYQSRGYSTESPGVCLCGRDGTLICYPSGYNCPNTFKIPDDITVVERSALSGCRFNRIEIPAALKNICDDNVDNCLLGYIGVDANNSRYKSIDGVLYSKDGKTLIRYPREKSDHSFVVPNGVKTIKGTAFAWNDYLHSVEIPDSVESIEDSAFFWCKNLETVVFMFPDNWILTEYLLGEPKKRVGWISADSIKDVHYAALLLRETFDCYEWKRVDNIRDIADCPNVDKGIDTSDKK